MSQDGFVHALAFAWRPENDGQPYHVELNDPGGATNYGVTAATWQAAATHGYVSGALKDATREDLARVLRILFWQTIRGDGRPMGVDQVVFDMGMLSGPGRAARLLQRVLRVEEDGEIGPITLMAAASADPKATVIRLTTEDEAFFASLSSASYFGRGWRRRAEDCRDAALTRLAIPKAV